MLNFCRSAFVIVICFMAAAADAQSLSRPGEVFVDVPVGLHPDDAYSDSTRVEGAAWGSGLAFGADWGRSGLEVGVGIPRWHVKESVYRYQFGGPSFGWEQQGHSYQSVSTLRRRSIDVTVMYRRNVPLNRRVTFTWLAGGGYVYRPEQFTSVTSEVLAAGQLTEVNTTAGTTYRNYLAATARVDLELKVAPHVSIAPRLRVTAFPSLLDDSGSAPRVLVARPEVAVRWRF